MRTIIAGSRCVTEQAVVEKAMAGCGWEPTVVLSGGARGADRQGEIWAKARGIPIERYPADWKLHGQYAGPVRNRDMAKVADGLVAIWDGTSRGTRGMIEIAKGRGLKVHVHLV